MEYEHLLYTVSDQTAIVTLNRPKAWNALCGALNTELESAIRRADGDPAVRAIVQGICSGRGRQADGRCHADDGGSDRRTGAADQ